MRHARKHLGWALDAAAETAGTAAAVLKTHRNCVLTAEQPVAVRRYLAEAYHGAKIRIPTPDGPVTRIRRGSFTAISYSRRKLRPAGPRASRCMSYHGERSATS